MKLNYFLYNLRRNAEDLKYFISLYLYHVLYAMKEFKPNIAINCHKHLFYALFSLMPPTTWIVPK